MTIVTSRDIAGNPLSCRFRSRGVVGGAACESLRGNYVDVVDLTGEVLVSGTVEGVAVDGCLLVRDERNGAVVPVSSGEAHIV